MQRVEITTEVSPHFIGAWVLEDLKLCDALIQFFEQHQEQQRQGVTLEGLNTNLKHSLDLPIAPAEMCSSWVT